MYYIKYISLNFISNILTYFTNINKIKKCIKSKIGGLVRNEQWTVACIIIMLKKMNIGR